MKQTTRGDKMDKQRFINDIATLVQKFAPLYNIKVCSPIIAQAILESGWGCSSLSSKYHNYFGLKCGSKWKGKSVNLSTKEEYTVGTLTEIKDNFRVFDSMEEGIKGYFEFISYSRYSNLKGVTDPFEYVRLIKEDGYATSSTYVDNVSKLIKSYNLTKYDSVTVSKPSEPLKSVSEVAKEVVQGLWGNGSERKQRLEKSGYDYEVVQQYVNAVYGNSKPKLKSVSEVAKEVIQGKWGNGKERKERLEKSGYDYELVQNHVNALLMGK